MRPTTGELRERSAQLMGYENQSEERSYFPLAIMLRKDGRRCGPGRVPVEAVYHGEPKQARRRGHIRQNEKRCGAKYVTDSEDFPRVDAIDQPTRERRADKACSAHDSNRPRSGHLRDASLDGVGNQVRADQTVGGKTANKKTAA